MGLRAVVAPVRGPGVEPLDVLVGEGFVSTRSVGASRRCAQAWHSSFMLSSIQAAGRSAAYSSIASTFQCDEPNTARPSNVRQGRSRNGSSSR
jgi:hypothetical protein